MLRRKRLLLRTVFGMRETRCAAKELAKSRLSTSIYLFHGCECHPAICAQGIVKQMVLVQMHRGKLSLRNFAGSACWFSNFTKQFADYRYTGNHLKIKQHREFLPGHKCSTENVFHTFLLPSINASSN